MSSLSTSPSSLKEPFYFLSDTHISTVTGPEQTARREKVLRVLDHVEKTGGTLFILGDFFDFWFDCRGYIHPHLQDMADRLENLTSRDIAIHYVGGNHDFWVQGTLTEKCSISFYPDDLSFSYKNTSFYCTHGDLAVYRKKIYPLARRLLHARWAIALLSCLPCRLIYKLGESVSSYNRPSAQIKPIETKYLERMDAFLLDKNRNGAHIALSGHVHVPYLKKDAAGTRAVLGDWIHHDRFGIWEKGDFRLESCQNLL